MNGLIVLKVTDALPMEKPKVARKSLNVLSPTLHEKPDAVYVDTGAVTQAAPHAGNPVNGIVIRAAATPNARLLIVASTNERGICEHEAGRYLCGNSSPCT